MQKVIVTNNGEIIGKVSGCVVDVGDNHTLIPYDQSPEGKYFNYAAQQVEERPIFPIVVNKSTIAADSTEEAIISNIPRGTVCTHDGDTYTVDDGLIEFTADHVGDYTFTFELFPYLPMTITVSATEPNS